MANQLQNALSQHYDDIIKNYTTPYIKKTTEVTIFFEQSIKKNGQPEVEVVVEYENGTPQYGFYYGLKIPVQQTLDHNVVLTIKNEFLTRYWVPKHPGNSTEDGRDIFLRDDNTKNSSDGKYWLFWIRVPDNESIEEAKRAARCLVRILNDLGYK